MLGQQFDEFARALATTTSRRQVVRVLGGGVLSGAAALLGLPGRSPTPTSAAAVTNSCAAFCGAIPPGPDRARCLADAEHGTGLCFDCLMDPTRLCGGAGVPYTCCAKCRQCDLLSGTCAPLACPSC